MEVITEYTPPVQWWDIEQELTLTPGTWASTNARHYSEADANASAQKSARDNNSPFRVVAYTEGVGTPVTVYGPPTSWWLVEENVEGSWSVVQEADNDNQSGRYFVESAAQAYAQTHARVQNRPTRVVLYPPA